jgi:hypothetical protein
MIMISAKTAIVASRDGHVSGTIQADLSIGTNKTSGTGKSIRFRLLFISIAT